MNEAKQYLHNQWRFKMLMPREILLEQQTVSLWNIQQWKQNDWQPYWNVISDRVRKLSEHCNPQTSHSKLLFWATCSYTVGIQFSVIIFVVEFLQHYKFSIAVISMLHCYVLNFLKIRQCVTGKVFYEAGALCNTVCVQI